METNVTEPAKNESVAIVGGGIIGIACAHYLAQSGLRVTLVDKGSIGGACSHANCGYICPSHVLPLTEPGAIGVALRSMFNPRASFRLKPQLSPALWRWLFEFGRRCTHRQAIAAGVHLKAILEASMSQYRELVGEFDFDCEWKQQGLLYVLQTQKAMDAFAKHDQMLTKQFGVAAQRIEGEALPRFDAGLNPDLAGAFHYESDASVRPDRLNQQWAQQLVDSGVQLLPKCELHSVVKESGKGVALKTSQGDLRADHFVFAMGALSNRWSRELGCSLPVQPGKGYSVTIERPENSPSHAMLFPEHNIGVSPFDQGLRLGSMMEFAGFDETIPARRIQQLRDSARPYLRASVDGRAQEQWYGWRPMTWDSLPIIGSIPSSKNMYLATGHNMLGLSLAPSTGRLIAELITDSPPHIDPAPYSPLRF
jgi:D-amino-acid dehydrogenase